MSGLNWISNRGRGSGLFVVCVLLQLGGLSAWAQSGYDTSKGQWPSYGGDLANSKYSPLDQINRDNIKDLQVAWIWNSPDDFIKPQLKAGLDRFKATPLMVDGVLYVRTSLNIALAIDAETGATLWGFNPQSYKWGRPASYGYTTRGLAYWKGEEDRADKAGQRLFLASGDSKLFAIDPKTGAPIQSFGEEGFVDLKEGLHRSIEGMERMMNYSGPPVVCRDVVILGSIISDGMGFFRGKKYPFKMPPGDVRAYDVRTGKLRWRFNTVPDKGEPGVKTWKNDSWKWVGGANVWSILSADEELGYVYLPVTAPSSNYYGGFRPGDNLYGQSLVCVDVTTGKRVWHFQTIHHPVWDLDLPAAPNLVDIKVDGKTIKAVAQISKTGFTYVFDRATGEPVWPIEERPVPTNGVPGEVLSPTQPYPTKPPPFDRQGITDDDLNDITPGIKKAAREFVSKYRTGPMFTPLSEKGTIILPGIGGGGDWPGAAFDPESGYLYVTSKTLPTLIKLIKEGPNSPWPLKYREEYSFPTVHGLSIVKPPWGRITAIDLNKGEIAWQKANSDGVRYYPTLKALKLPPTGNPSKFNVMATKTLLFSPVTGGRGVLKPDGKPALSRLRALDKKTGDIIWEHPLTPSYNGGGPMTYMWKGRQYVVVPTGGANQTSHLVAFRLKREGDPELTAKLPPAPVLRKIPTEVMGKVSASEAKGFEIFQARCLGCHTIGNGPLLGPDLFGSDKKPAVLLKVMTGLMRLNRGVEITDEEIEQVVAFLKREDAAAILYAK
jgi:quinoprotein glucose dehydrogenase